MTLQHAAKWSLLSELAAKTIQPVVLVVLARLLTPEDFGVTAAALMVIGFSQIFWEAGMGKAVIQRQSDIEDAANAAFWINIGLGVVVAGVLFISAGPIADTFFHDLRVKAVIQVMTILVLLGSVSSVHVALLQKEMGFKKLFWVRFATVGLPGVASIPLAMTGIGYWALVVGVLIGQAAQVVILWKMSHWRPRWSFHLHVAGELGRFGAWVGLSGLLAWFYVWADSLVVGAYLGSHELGLYRTGNQAAMMIFAILFGPIVPVLYSHLSRMNQEADRLRNAAEKVIRTLTFIAIPISMIVFSLAEPIGDALFGQKWDGIGFVIGVMALTHGFSWIVGMNGEIYRAMGRPSYEAAVPAALLIFYLAAYLISVRGGIEIFAWTRLGLALAALLVHIFVMKKLLDMSVYRIIRYLLLITVVCGVFIYSVKIVVVSKFSDSWLQILAGGVSNTVILAIVLFIIGKNDVLKDLRSIMKERSG